MNNLNNEKAPRKSLIDRIKEKSAAKAAHKKEVKEQHDRIVSSLSEAEYRDFKLEKMRYFENSLSHKLGYAGILFSVIAMFFALNTVSPVYFLNGFGTVLAILMNIFILLTGFLTVEKVKNYSIGYSQYMIGLGAICVLRIFWYPLNTIIVYNKLWSDIKNSGETWGNIVNKYNGSLGASIISGTPKRADGTVVLPADQASDIQSITTSGYFSSDCNLRGAVMIVCLVLAAACFIGGGIIGYLKSKKLKDYLESKKN